MQRVDSISSQNLMAGSSGVMPHSRKKQSWLFPRRQEWYPPLAGAVTCQTITRVRNTSETIRGILFSGIYEWCHYARGTTSTSFHEKGMTVDIYWIYPHQRLRVTVIIDQATRVPMSAPTPGVFATFTFPVTSHQSSGT